MLTSQVPCDSAGSVPKGKATVPWPGFSPYPFQNPPRAEPAVSKIVSNLAARPAFPLLVSYPGSLVPFTLQEQQLATLIDLFVRLLLSPLVCSISTVLYTNSLPHL